MLSQTLKRCLVSRKVTGFVAQRNACTVGFIGLGNMGSRMAENLLKKEYKVVAYDTVEQSLKDLEAKGASTANSVASVAAETELIVSMLPSSPQVQEVYLSKDGVLNNMRSGSLLIDCSTIDPAVSQQVAQQATAKNAVFMDAPVSGGVGAAAAGTLTFMVGGPEVEFAAAKELLQHMGKNIVHCGVVGTGQTAKICNNMLLAISMIGVSEALNLGKRLGLDPKILSGILNTSSGRCWSSDTYNPVPGVLEGVPSSNNYEGGFGTALMTKDLGLAQIAATNTQTPTPLGSLSHQIYRQLCQKGHAQKDFSSIYDYMKEKDQ